VTARASVRFVDDDLDPASASALLGVQPDLALRRGEPRPDRPDQAAMINSWLVGSRIESLRLEDHVRDLVGILDPAAEAVRALADRVEVAEVLCLWITDYSAGAGPELSPDVLGALGRLGLKLRLDFYDIGDDGDPGDPPDG
jgi:hypothetical protein